MGWIEYHASYYKNGKVDRKTECDNHFDENKCKVLKSAMVGSTYYAAVAIENKVIAAITLTHTDNKKYDNFAYKGMDETYGPYESNCPKGILDLLTPTDNEYANAWRKRCYENLSKKNNPNSLSKLPVGSVIKYTDRNGKEIVLYKHSTAYQFKRPFWMLSDNSGYISPKHIPDNYEVIKRGE